MTGGGQQARDLATKMSKAWLNFAKTGNPDHSGLPPWKPFTKDNGATMIFNNNSEIRKDPDGEARQLLEHLFYQRDI